MAMCIDRAACTMSYSIFADTCRYFDTVNFRTRRCRFHNFCPCIQHCNCTAKIMQRKLKLMPNSTNYFSLIIYLIIVHFVDTLSTIFAWRRQTFINIQLTINATKSSAGAIAQKSAQFVFALTTMLTWLRFAVVDINFAISSSHSVDANARVVCNAINAR